MASAATGKFEVDGKIYLLGGAKASSFPTPDKPGPAGGQSTSAFEGNFGAFIESHGGKDAPNAVQLFNSVKACTACGKPCAVTMKACNGCGDSLVETPISKTNNIFMGFVHGVQFKVSIRLQREDILVFDDPLAVTRAHILSVPTDVYCPDIRGLFTAPEVGRKMLQRMDDAGWEAMSKWFLDDEAFCSKNLSAAGRALPREEMRNHVIAAFNLPPSQFQLHLQYMLPPFTPFHYGMVRAGKHYNKGRHFPLVYVVAALDKMIADGKEFSDAGGMAPDELIKRVLDETGVDYDVYYEADYKKYLPSHELFACYDTADFTHAVPEGNPDEVGQPKLLSELIGAPVFEGASSATNAKDLETEDKLVLQSYGRPYGEDGKPSGSFYSHPRPPPLETMTQQQ